jgi:uncharacterized cupredoxin-like copper-binding protein
VSLRVLLLVGLVLLLAACGSDDDESEPQSADTTISLIDFALDPDEVSVDEGGNTTFRVVNDGQTEHALEIEGAGIEEETDVLGPGESAELTVELEEGEYELYCPVGNHREQGMEGTLTVGSGTAGASTDDSGGGDDDEDSGYYP